MNYNEFDKEIVSNHLKKLANQNDVHNSSNLIKDN